jgi:hypothetical protein
MVLRKTQKQSSATSALHSLTLREKRPKWWWVDWLGLAVSLFGAWRLRTPFFELLCISGLIWFSLRAWMQLKALKLRIMAEGLLLQEGSIGKKYFFSWEEVKQAQIVKDNQSLPFGSPGLSRQVIQQAEAIVLYYGEERSAFKIKASLFNKKEFSTFLFRLYQTLQWRSNNWIEKIDYLMSKIQEHKQQDLQIIQELEEALFDAYRTIYQPIYLQDEQAAQKAVWVYRRGQRPIAFYADRMLPGVSQETIQVAEELIKVSQENMGIVQTRLAYYDSIMQVLTEKRKEAEQQQKLKEVAGKLKAIQVRNIKKQEMLQSSEEDSLMMENLMLLDEITSKVHQIENLEDSFLLSQYLDQIKSEVLAHNQVLRELNEKLKDGDN